MPDSEHKTTSLQRPSPSISGNADQDILHSISVQVGPFTVDVLIDDAGRFRGVARVSVEPSTSGIVGRFGSSIEDVEKYYDAGGTDEP
jgi:hypothetical protein